VTRVIHVAADLGQGGTERAIELLASAAEGPPGQRVVALDRDGPTGARLRAAGIPVEVFAGDHAAAAAAIAAGAGEAPTVALLNRSGRPEAKWIELIRRLSAGPVLPLEVSHFGWLDRDSIAAGLKGSFAVSGTTLAKYLRQMFGRWPSEAEIAAAPLALAAGNNPVVAAEPLAEDRVQIRRSLGLPPDTFIALRLGRPDPRKWSDLMILHGARLLAAVPRLHLVFLSAPESRHGVIRRLMGNRVTLAPFTTERAVIARYLAGCDVMLHYARYGESFGYALAEAALAGLPVIAQATPWGDNAQAELIRDAETGFLVHDLESARRALARLEADPAFARTLAAAAAADIAARFGLAATWRLLEAFIAHARSGGRGLLTQPADLAADQRRRLSVGIASYGARHPLLARLSAERPLYLRPWFWRLTARDGAEIARRRLAR
jgi:glycosyltransferase involved in cell wall biosynthesis